MAARETGFGAVESYMHQGKLLALDLLVRVLTNPMHDWGHMRPEFAGEPGAAVSRGAAPRAREGCEEPGLLQPTAGLS